MGATPLRRGPTRVPNSGRFLTVLDAVLRRLPVLVLVAALPFFAAAFWLKLVPATYVATATVFADPETARGGANNSRQAIANLAVSRAVLERVTARSDLAGELSYVTASGFAQRLGGLIDRIRGREPTPASAALIRESLGSAIAARPANESNITEISARSTDAGIAARLANATADAFVSEVIAVGVPQPGATNGTRSARGEDLRRRLRDAEEALNRFRNDNNLSPDAGRDTAGQLQRIRAQATEQKARYEQIQKLLASGREAPAIADLVHSPAVDRLRNQYNEAVAQESSMRSTLGPRHPSYLEAQQQVQEKKKLLMESLRLVSAAARADWQAAIAQERELERQSGGAAPPAANTPGASTDLTGLAERERAVENARSAYDAYLASAEGAGEGRAARIIRPAMPPVAPASPTPATIWAIAAAFSALFALLVVLRAIPRASHAAPGALRPKRSLFRSRRQRRQPELVDAIVPKAQAVEPVGVASPQREAAAAETVAHTPPIAFRASGDETVLVDELSEKAWSSALQTVFVTGEIASDAVAAAIDIATQAADRNLRVLMLDADERNPVLSRILRDAPLAGHVTLHGRKRIMASFEAERGNPMWLVPAESTLATTPAFDLPLAVASVAGNFDLLIMTGPPVGADATVAILAQAAEVIALIGAETETASHYAAKLGISVAKMRMIRSGPLPEKSEEPLSEMPPSLTPEAPRGGGLFRFQT